MTKILTLLIGLTLLSTPAMAKDAMKDDGGFGSGFAGTAPAALGDYTAPDANAFAADTSTPADIEPAAGEEEDIQSPEDVLNAPSTATPPSELPHVEKMDTENAPKE